MTIRPNDLYERATRHLDEDYDIADGLAIELVEQGYTLPGCDDDERLLAGELRSHLMNGYGWDSMPAVVTWLALHAEDLVRTESYITEFPLMDPRIP